MPKGACPPRIHELVAPSGRPGGLVHAGRLAISIALLATACGIGHADTFLTFGGAPSLITWERQSGQAGRLYTGSTFGDATYVDILAPPQFIEPMVEWFFSADFVAGSSRWVVNRADAKIKIAQFTNGTFALRGASGVLVSGSFSDGSLVANNGTLTFSVLGSGVSYDSGTGIVGTDGITGDLAFSIVGHGLGMQGWSQVAGNITNSWFNGTAGGSFEATGSPNLGGTYPLSSTSLPEPGEWAGMGVLGAGLAGLVLRKRRIA